MPKTKAPCSGFIAVWSILICVQPNREFFRMTAAVQNSRESHLEYTDGALCKAFYGAIRQAR